MSDINDLIIEVRKMRIAVVGVTGLVGGVMLEVLKERKFEITELIPVASERSVGKEILFNGKSYRVVSMADGVKSQPDIAIFSAGGSASKEWAPKFAAAGTFVVDNSSAWRMDPNVPLVVPEINADLLNLKTKIIANPNCSTIQMVAVLHPLHKAYGIKRLVVSTYQSFTGTGVKAVRQYEAEKDGRSVNGDRAYPHPIFENCLPHCDVFLDNGYTKEEMKLVHETRKILRKSDIPITATAVRVPVHGGHSESVNVEFEKPFEVTNVRTLLENTDGVEVQDNPSKNEYPMPYYAKNMNEVYVGRIRRDESIPNGLNLWIVSDNLRKGAATNAVQIAEYLVAKGIVTRVMA